MNTFTISVKIADAPLTEDILTENASVNIEDIYEYKDHWVIIVSTNKSAKELREIVSEYVCNKDFFVC